MPLLSFLLAAQLATPDALPSEAAGQEAPLGVSILRQLDPCRHPARGDEIVVCGPRGAGERYRIPEALRADTEPGRRISGIGSASLDADQVGPCGIHQGQRRCSKAEAAHHGYGNGRDPLTAAGKIISELTDPD